uniref:Uncharacterized protein n=1 Tax=Mucochytrium quahogii TaxID=96639 RepID=A0A7S2RAQ1_9STRA|mmetsp:Transcript_12189/g.26069  ORF Transcript_12189/g.26069 Transcript_12189/m.26069 type:complete len:752 (+) Transcript_12189:256-2511(+)
MKKALKGVSLMSAIVDSPKRRPPRVRIRVTSWKTHFLSTRLMQICKLLQCKRQRQRELQQSGKGKLPMLLLGLLKRQERLPCLRRKVTRFVVSLKGRGTNGCNWSKQLQKRTGIFKRILRRNKEVEDAAQARLASVLAEKERLAQESQRQKEEFEARERELALSREAQSQKRAQQFLAEREKAQTAVQGAEQLRVELQHAQAASKEYERLLELERMEHAKSRSTLEAELQKEQRNAASLIEDAFNNSKQEKELLEKRIEEMKANFEKQSRDEVLQREQQSIQRAKMFQAEQAKGSQLQQQYMAEKQAHAEEIQMIRRDYEEKLAQANHAIQSVQNDLEKQKSLMESQFAAQVQANRQSDRAKLEDTLQKKRAEYEAQKARDLQEISNAKAMYVEEKGSRERLEMLLAQEQQKAQKQRDELNQAYAAQIRSLQGELEKEKQARLGEGAMMAELKGQVQSSQANMQRFQAQYQALSQQVQGQSNLINQLTKEKEDLARQTAAHAAEVEQIKRTAEEFRLQAQAEVEARKAFEQAANARINQERAEAYRHQQAAYAAQQQNAQVMQEKQQLDVQRMQLAQEQQKLNAEKQQQAYMAEQERKRQQYEAQAALQQQQARQQAEMQRQQDAARAAQQQAQQQAARLQQQQRQAEQQQRAAASRARHEQAPRGPVTPATWKPAPAYGNTYATPAPLNLPTHNPTPQYSMTGATGPAPTRSAPPAAPGMYNAPPGQRRAPPPAAPGTQPDPFANLNYRS